MHYVSAYAVPWRVGYTYSVTLAADLSKKLFYVGNTQNPVSLDWIPVSLVKYADAVGYTYTDDVS